MDLRMPNLDGAGALAECRRRYPEAATKYVAVSATNPRAPTDVGATFDDFLRKPVSLKDVYTCLERVLGATFEVVGDAVRPAARQLPEIDDAFAEALAEAATRGQLSRVRRLLTESASDASRRAFIEYVCPLVDRVDLEGLAELLARRT
jgi:CheY-like chemotaxis protein